MWICCCSLNTKLTFMTDETGRSGDWAAACVRVGRVCQVRAGLAEQMRPAGCAGQRVRRQDDRRRGVVAPLGREVPLVGHLPAGPVGAVMVAQLLDAGEQLMRPFP